MWFGSLLKLTGLNTVLFINCTRHATLGGKRISPLRPSSGLLDADWTPPLGLSPLNHFGFGSKQEQGAPHNELFREQIARSVDPVVQYGKATIIGLKGSVAEKSIVVRLCVNVSEG